MIGKIHFKKFIILFFLWSSVTSDVLDYDILSHFSKFVEEVRSDELVPTNVRDERTKVTIKNGTIQGMITRSLHTEKEIYTYKAIPFAKPPVRELRFEPPQPADGWVDVLDAIREPRACAQMFTNIRPPSEDCLYLNIYSRRAANETEKPLLPVMAWIHGGGFALGEISYYGGLRLLEYGDVVFVAIQYRLGPFGFLSTGDSIVPGNMGLKDQNMALRWIQENIEAFGGDPNNVMLFGESAGAASTVYQMISPLSKGLFHKAAPMSGTALAEWSIDRNPWEATEKLAKRLKCSTLSTAEVVSCLKKVPWPLITTTFYSVIIPHLMSLRIELPLSSAVIEPDLPGAFLTRDPLDLLQNGDLDDIPVIMGAVQHEGTLPLAGFHYLTLKPSGLLDDPEYVHDRLTGDLLKTYNIDDSKNGASLSQMAAMAFYSDAGSNRSDFSNIMYGALDMLSVGFMKAPILRTVEILNRRFKSPTYLYSAEHPSQYSLFHVIFALVTGLIGGEVPPFDPGMCHADDIIFMFNYPFEFSPDDDKFSEIYCKVFVNFAIYGDPTPESSELLKWPEYLIKDPKYYKLNSSPSVQRGYQNSWNQGMW